MITFEPLGDVPGVRHAFFTRRDGVSGGVYASLNCGFGSNDDREAVAENRARVAGRLGVAPDRLLTVYQIHSAEAVTAESPWRREELPRADAMVTDRPGLALGVLTADCAPVLIADRRRRVVGAAHAGWKGAMGGVIDATVARMRALGAEPADLVAAVGPCIDQRSYEVGPEFRDRFLAEDPANAAFFVPGARPDHPMFDLPGYVMARLRACGVPEVVRYAGDTVSEEESFFSYRRATLRREPDYGRGISVIVIEP